jgi:hypothetical protein
MGIYTENEMAEQARKTNAVLSRTDVSPVQKPDLQHFTPEQIEEFVRRATENDCGPAFPDLI